MIETNVVVREIEIPHLSNHSFGSDHHRMISDEEYKKLLGSDADLMTEAELLRVRQDLEMIASGIFNWWLRRRNDGSKNSDEES